MAKRIYFESTYTFRAEACIDYAYTCSKCGKPVSGVIKLPFSYGYRKTAPRREDQALTDAERRDGQAKVQSVMKSELAIYRSRFEKGNYDLLRSRSVSTCPHCGAGQRWGHRPAKAIALLLMGVLLLAGTVVGAVMFFGKGGTLYTLSPEALIGGCMAGSMGVMMIPYNIIELRKTRASVGLAGSRPTVRFPLVPLESALQGHPVFLGSQRPADATTRSLRQFEEKKLVEYAASLKQSRAKAAAPASNAPLLVYLDIDRLGGGFYGLAAGQAVARALSADEMEGIAISSGDSAATLAGSANEYVIGLSGEASHLDRIEARLRSDAALGELLSRPGIRRSNANEPLVADGMVREGELINPPGHGTSFCAAGFKDIWKKQK